MFSKIPNKLSSSQETMNNTEVRDKDNQPASSKQQLQNRINAQFVQQPDSMPPKHDSKILKRVAPAAETVIGADLIIIGNVTSKGTVRLEGTLTGDMKCVDFVVEQSGSVSGNIEADQVSINGQVKGRIHAQNVMLKASAIVEGDIHHKGIGIELGAQYEGCLKTIKDEKAILWNNNISQLQAAE